MAQKSINLGTGYNTKDGDSVRDAFNKVNQNFTELYTLTGGTVADLTEIAQDYAAEMFVNATHTGITVNYDDVNNVLELTGFDGELNSLTTSPFTFTPQNVGGGISSELSINSQIVDFGTGNTIDLQNNTVNLTGATVTGLDAPYTPANVSQWLTPPTTVGEALDRLADYIYQSNGNIAI